MTVSITIRCDSPPFDDDPSAEVSRILLALASGAKQLPYFLPGAHVPCFDANGADVGCLIVRS